MPSTATSTQGCRAPSHSGPPTPTPSPRGCSPGGGPSRSGDPATARGYFQEAEAVAGGAGLAHAHRPGQRWSAPWPTPTAPRPCSTRAWWLARRRGDRAATARCSHQPRPMPVRDHGLTEDAGRRSLNGCRQETGAATRSFWTAQGLDAHDARHGILPMGSLEGGEPLGHSATRFTVTTLGSSATKRSTSTRPSPTRSQCAPPGASVEQ